MDAQAAGEHWALVLAGGDGRRLQALTQAISGAPIPKQYCRILGDRSLLESTLLRTSRFAPRERTLVVVNRDHLEVAGDQLSGLPTQSLLIQPQNCDTGPGLLFSLLHLAQRHARGTVAVFPSDHYIGDDQAFVDYVRRGAQIVAAQGEKIVLLGIPPDRCDPGFGYIVPGEPLRAEPHFGAAFHVAGFQEKPTPGLARRLVSRGGLWNSFVMVFRIERMLDLLSRVAPARFEEMCALPADPLAAAAHYDQLNPWNFSTEFLGRIPEHLLVLRVDNVHWSDWGTQQAIERTLRLLKKRPPWRPRRVARVAA
jgi:mannose-1-phosphate guanylyltransferase